ncbi:MAG TPA: hypothetical protein VNQ90_13080 [Chthoniobacteraceae bacterium]|nr:hypothetical protein [Chthoniobacteraceae bacterium]
MKKVWELWVVHHSHTDWGYTTHQSRIEEVHLRFIDEAIRLCVGNEDREASLRYRWTCESAWVVREFLRQRPPGMRRKFLDCVSRGDIEVAALPLQPTPLADARTIRAALTILDELRAEGIPVVAALGCDINGLNWPWADALLDAGVAHLCMAMNFVCGGGLPRWSHFHWKAPSGRLLSCWQGTHYNHGAYWGLNHQAYAISEVAQARVKELEKAPFEKLLLQVTNIPPDNMGPHPRYLQGLQEYNRLATEHGWPLMRTSTLAEWTSWLAAHAKESPVYQGDWTDWWAAGVASTPRETAALMDAQRRAALAESNGLDPLRAIEVRKKIFLAAEHTWGASTSVSAPYAMAAQAGLTAKQNLIYEAAYAAHEAVRAAVADKAVVFDPRFESFDPTWRAVAGAQQQKAYRSLAPVVDETTEPPPWGELLGKNFAHLLLEEPVCDGRSAWFERGTFRQPDSAGQWADGSKLKRTPLPDPKVATQQEGSELKVEVSFALDLSAEPRSVYVVFPFARKAEEIRVDVGGTWADPRREQIPGSCENWWTLHHGVFLRFGQAGLLWTPWDAPLTMFDAPCPVPPKPPADASASTLVSWALNTYWFTNFSALSGGDYRFRYRLKYWPSAPSLEAVDAYARANPLPEYPLVASHGMP